MFPNIVISVPLDRLCLRPGGEWEGGVWGPKTFQESLRKITKKVELLNCCHFQCLGIQEASLKSIKKRESIVIFGV